MGRQVLLGPRREPAEVIEEPGPGQPGRVLWPDGMLTEITHGDLERLEQAAAESGGAEAGGRSDQNG